MVSDADRDRPELPKTAPAAAPTIAATLAHARERLAAVSDSARLDAELLLARAIDMPRSFVYAHPDDELDDDSIARFEATVARRLAGEPMAYIDGTREFWSLPLMVTPATLIPRPETEVLVEHALGFLPQSAALSVLDLGTGSGAIALAIASQRPLSDVVATDASEAALAVARVNARQLGLPNVTFLEGDWVAPVADRRFDLIVANPPYVAAGDPALEALRCEPRDALSAGNDGLDALRRIAARAPRVIRPGGRLLLEHGATQHGAVGALLDEHGWTEIACARDLAGLPRVSIGRWPEGAISCND